MTLSEEERTDLSTDDDRVALARRPAQPSIDRQALRRLRRRGVGRTRDARSTPRSALGARPTTTRSVRTEWYRSQPQEIRAEIGLSRIVSNMKVGLQFENVLKRGLLEFAAKLPNGTPEFRYAYHEVIEEGSPLDDVPGVRQSLRDRSAGHAEVHPDAGRTAWCSWAGASPRCSSSSCSAAKTRSTTCSARRCGRPRAASAARAHHAHPRHRRGAPPVVRPSPAQAARAEAQPREEVRGVDPGADHARRDGRHDAATPALADPQVRHPRRRDQRGVRQRRGPRRRRPVVAQGPRPCASSSAWSTGSRSRSGKPCTSGAEAQLRRTGDTMCIAGTARTQRIVSLLPSTTEILFAIGAGDAVVGVTFECDWPSEAKTRTIVSTSTLPSGLTPAEIDREVRERIAAGEDLYRLDEGALRAPRPRRGRHPGSVRGVCGRRQQRRRRARRISDATPTSSPSIPRRSTRCCCRSSSSGA